MIVYINYFFLKLKPKFDEEWEFLKYFEVKNRKSFARFYSPFSIWDLGKKNIDLLKDATTRKKTIFIRRLVIQLFVILFLYALISAFVVIPEGNTPFFLKKHLPSIPKMR